MSVRRVRIDLAYDGTDFAGWQFQPGQRTVQGTLEAALRRLAGGEGRRVRGAGRTDAGAHARQQVADHDFTGRHGDAELQHSLRGILPPDLRVVRARTVDPAFDARRDARAKTYRYRLDTTPHGDPFLARYALHHPDSFDRDRVRDALARLPGRRDWSGFTAASCEIVDRIREVRRAQLIETGTEIHFEFTADGFLTHMVRNVVGTLLEVARGRFEPARIDRILESRDRSLAGRTAPAHGLCLMEIRYPGEDG